MNKLAEQHEALGHYIDALLTSGDLAADADGPRPAGAAAPIIESCGHDTGARDFMIVQVRDLKLAIDAARVQSVMPFPASGVDCRDGDRLSGRRDRCDRWAASTRADRRDSRPRSREMACRSAHAPHRSRA